jgi:hypothetical protein
VTPPAPFRQLPLSRLGHLIPPLVEGQALVALVAATADNAWAAKAAWDIARIAAREGRRVALVDLRLDEPYLHQSVGLEVGDGIVDAFEYGVSLAKAAREIDKVFFISSGSDTASAAELYAHPRWRKLQAGFRSEGALLLLFLSPAGLTRLLDVAPPDGVIVLAPEGIDPASLPAFGGSVLGVARDRWMPSFREVAPPQPVFIPPVRRRGVRAGLATLGLATVAVGGWALFAGARESPPLPPPMPAFTAPAPPPAVTPPSDSLGWTIQVAAFGSEEKARAHADRLTRDTEIRATVAPAPQDGGVTWYRVLAGSYPTRQAAAAARDTLWQRGAVARGIGTLLPRMGKP